MLKNEINQYCENVLDIIVTNMANAEYIESSIYNNNIAITTENTTMGYKNTFYLDNYSGILQNNNPIHTYQIRDIFDYKNNPNIDDKYRVENFPAQYFIRYSPFEKDGRIKYILDSWEIELLNEFEEYQDVYNIEPVTPLSIKVNSLTYMIKINVKLVAGGNEDFPKEYLIFSRSVFCPNAQAYGMDLLNVL